MYLRDNAGNKVLEFKIPGSSDVFGHIAYFGPTTTTSNKCNLGQTNAKWNTLYCNNLSDGNTTKTMTKLLSNASTSMQTTAPTSEMRDGGIHIVYLESEPETKYYGYIYLIKEAIQ